MFITSFSNEVATEVEPGYWTWYCDFNKVTQGIKESLGYYKNLLDADTVTICLSDDQENFRKQILGTYKEKRLRVKRPLVLKEVRRYLLEELDGYTLPNLEGDVFRSSPRIYLARISTVILLSLMDFAITFTELY